MQEIGGHEVIGIDRSVTEKMEARAKRFNLQSAGINIHYDDMIGLYKRYTIEIVLLISGVFSNITIRVQHPLLAYNTVTLIFLI